VILSYGDLGEARTQRRSLMQAGNIAPVPNERLVKAIQTALGQQPVKQSWGPAHAPRPRAPTPEIRPTIERQNLFATC
jgi:hypothetical protein